MVIFGIEVFLILSQHDLSFKPEALSLIFSIQCAMILMNGTLIAFGLIWSPTEGG